MTTQIAVRIDDQQLRAIDALVPAAHPSRSDLIRRAIELYLYRLECERDAAVYDAHPLTDAELVLADDAAAWSSTPAW